MNRRRKYRLTVFALLIFTQIFAQNSEKEKPIPLHFENQSLDKVLEKIHREYKIDFIYDDNLVKGVLVSCAAEESNINSALNRLFKNKPISYKLYDKSTVVLYKSTAKKPESRPVITKKEEKTEIALKEFHNLKLITKAEPSYPPLAVQCGIEGRVTVKIFVSESGKVIKTKVKKSSGSKILDSAAIAYSKNLKFEPARQNGKRIKAWTKMDYEFSIVKK